MNTEANSILTNLEMLGFEATIEHVHPYTVKSRFAENGTGSIAEHWEIHARRVSRDPAEVSMLIATSLALYAAELAYISATDKDSVLISVYLTKPSPSQALPWMTFANLLRSGSDFVHVTQDGIVSAISAS